MQLGEHHGVDLVGLDLGMRGGDHSDRLAMADRSYRTIARCIRNARRRPVRGPAKIPAIGKRVARAKKRYPRVG